MSEGTDAIITRTDAAIECILPVCVNTGMCEYCWYVNRNVSQIRCNVHPPSVHRYTALTSPLYIIGVWDCQLGAWGPWDQVEEVSGLLGVPTVPVLFKGEV